MRISDWSSECALPICMARHPGMPGKYMDVALHNRSGPGTPASQAIPKGLRLGDEIELLPPERKQARNDGGADGSTNPQDPADGGPYTIRYYWGCGGQGAAGQRAGESEGHTAEHKEPM